jgi:hypothetical protein
MYLLQIWYSLTVPEITSFYGIRITMYYNDHLPPHFHAEYGDDEILIEINTLNIYAGEIPRRALRFTLEWATQNQTALQQLWELCRAGQPLHKLLPLE